MSQHKDTAYGWCEAERERFRRECATPKDDWEGREKDYIRYLYDGFTYDRDKTGNLIKLRGKEAIEKKLSDYLDNPDCSSYHQAIHRGYRDWMLTVRKQFKKMCKKGRFKPVDSAAKEREETAYWKAYYDAHPQFARPDGI
jgi:hypothetical protein